MVFPLLQQSDSYQQMELTGLFASRAGHRTGCSVLDWSWLDSDGFNSLVSELIGRFRVRWTIGTSPNTSVVLFKSNSGRRIGSVVMVIIRTTMSEVWQVLHHWEGTLKSSWSYPSPKTQLILVHNVWGWRLFPRSFTTDWKSNPQHIQEDFWRPS